MPWELRKSLNINDLRGGRLRKSLIFNDLGNFCKSLIVNRLGGGEGGLFGICAFVTYN